MAWRPHDLDGFGLHLVAERDALLRLAWRGSGDCPIVLSDELPNDSGLLPAVPPEDHWVSLRACELHFQGRIRAKLDQLAAGELLMCECCGEPVPLEHPGPPSGTLLCPDCRAAQQARERRNRRGLRWRR